MTSIVLEGPDGAGKSTLAQILSVATGMRIQQGSGPPREPGEIERRAAEYLSMTDVIFDRHPLVSQHMYAEVRGEPISEEFHRLTSELYRLSPLFIYCRSLDVSRHVVKGEESQAHVEMIERHYNDLVSCYDAWALRRAHLIYRIGDDVDELTRVIRRVVSPAISPEEVLRDAVRRVNIAHARRDGTPARLQNLGEVMTSVIEALVSAVNRRMDPPGPRKNLGHSLPLAPCGYRHNGPCQLDGWNDGLKTCVVALRAPSK